MNGILRTKIFFICLSVPGYFFSSNIFAADLQKIMWVKNDAPPFYIFSGKEKNRGFGDLLQEMIEIKMPQYEHVTAIMPLARLNYNWRVKEPFCFSTMIHEKYENKKYALSIPNIYYFPHGIITTKEFAEKISVDYQAISLEKLLRQTDIRMGTITDRTYDTIIDGILKRNEDHIVSIKRSGIDETEGILNMLVKKRFDFFIDYKYVLDYYLNEKNDESNLIFLPIKEVEGTGVSGAIGCTKSEWGENVIRDINQAIYQVRNNEEYKDILRKWLVFPGHEKEYWNLYQRNILTY